MADQDFIPSEDTNIPSFWRQVGAVTGTRFAHTGQQPGVAVSYRISASHNGFVSVPSQSAGVYGGVPEEVSTPVPLRLAA